VTGAVSDLAAHASGKVDAAEPNSPEDVLAHVPRGADLIVPVAAGEPVTLLDTLEANHGQLDGVRIHGMDPSRERAYIRGEFGDHLRHVDYYLGPASRAMWSHGGKGFIVLKSVTSHGRGRIRTQPATLACCPDHPRRQCVDR
jgi:hypothetical protein